jgi:hypothetical protein
MYAVAATNSARPNPAANRLDETRLCGPCIAADTSRRVRSADYVSS